MDQFTNNLYSFLVAYRAEILVILLITTGLTVLALLQNRKYFPLAIEKCIYCGDDKAKAIQGTIGNLILSGKPDYIVVRNGKYIPLEYKSTLQPKNLYYRRFQMASYFAIIEHVFGKKPPYGEFLFKDLSRKRIKNTTVLRKDLQNRIKRMTGILDNPHELIRNHNNYRKCNACDYKETCLKRVY